MNPYLIDHENGISYIDRYFDFLTRRTQALLALERSVNKHTVREPAA